jgi:hypothetical protein
MKFERWPNSTEPKINFIASLGSGRMAVLQLRGTQRRQQPTRDARRELP